MNRMEILKIVEQFSRKVDGVEAQITVTQVADAKTMYVETIGEIGRSIIFNEYQVDGKTYWAGFSSRSNTVFVSKAS